MFDIGWSEMLIIGVVALVVVGPKDLPKMFHSIGQFTGKARGMAREFQRAMEGAAKEAGVDGLAKDIRKVTSGRAIKEAVGFDKIENEFRTLGRDMTDTRKGAKAGIKAESAGADADADEEAFDEIEVHDHDADLAARNAKLSAVDEQRLIRADKIAASRRQAAEIRARRDAPEAPPQGEGAPSPAPHPAPHPDAES